MKEKLVFNSEGNDAPENRLMLGGNTTGIANLNSVKYKWASQLYKIMLNNFWIPEKISLVEDRNTIKELTPDELEAFKNTLSFLIALPMVGIDLTVLSVFGGALGVGLGFGLQKVASNYVSGFIVLFDRSVRVGDRVNVNNFNGYVTKITTRYTVVKDANGAEALVPNENFIANMVINESYSGKALWRTIPIQVAYNTDLSKALAIMKAAAEKQERVRLNAERLNHWVGQGAQMSEAVAKLVKEQQAAA